jgi:hypothetical protein
MKDTRNILVIDVGGTHIKLLATGQTQRHEIASGPTMTAGEMVRKVKDMVKDWDYEVISIGYPGPVVRGTVAVPIAELDIPATHALSLLTRIIYPGGGLRCDICDEARSGCARSLIRRGCGIGDDVPRLPTSSRRTDTASHRVAGPPGEVLRTPFRLICSVATLD